MRRIIVVKSAVHFRQAYGPIAKKIYDVFCRGMAEQKITSEREFAHCRRPIYPLDDL
jgi:microcystin degradation protein MlrC